MEMKGSNSPEQDQRSSTVKAEALEHIDASDPAEFEADLKPPNRAKRSSRHNAGRPRLETTATSVTQVWESMMDDAHI